MFTKALIIGSGFAGLSAACTLAAEGLDVEVIEKNEQAGGRARLFEEGGFRFDMGPSWYWMPDVFERFFNRFGKKSSEYYTLKRLDPSYSVFFEDNTVLKLPAGEHNVADLFGAYEKDGRNKLKKFLKEAEFKYKMGIEELVYKPALSYKEFNDWGLMKSAIRLDVFRSFSSHVKKYFKEPKLIQLLEFPVLFLGAKPSKTPALYSLMNYADISLGTWYPMGGMNKIVEGMFHLGESLGVKYEFNSSVEKIIVEGNRATGVIVNGRYKEADVIIGAADYHHVEQKLLEAQNRSYSDKYWDNKTLAPSSLIFYLGVNKKIKKLTHHNLFFDADFSQHSKEIYETKKWPENPLFYVCCPSKTDDTVAPEGEENLFILIPISVGLIDTEEIREKYYKIVLERIEKHTGEEIMSHVVVKRSYAGSDFIRDYNSFKGNAYGLANTLNQTAIFRPSIKSKKVTNLYFAGQLTVPGPGVPPAIISGQVAADQIVKDFKERVYEPVNGQ